jgi:hypothetical protein
MLAAVDLDDQLSLHAGEIDDIVTDWNLASEAAAEDLFSSQSKPEAPFDLSHFSAQTAGARNF